MKAQDANLRFPVLAITTVADPMCGVWGAPSLEILTSCGRRTLREGLHVGLEIIDLEGRLFVVRSARRLGRDRPLLSWLVKTLLAGRQFRVELDLEAQQLLSLEAVQEKVGSAINSHAAYWSDGDESGRAVRSLVAKVSKTRTIKALHKVLDLEYFRAH